MRRRQSSRKGAAAVEFAIVLPLLILLLFGIIEFSVICYDKAMLTNAAREGARLGIVYNVDPDTGDYVKISKGDIDEIIQNYLETKLINFKGESYTTDVQWEDVETNGGTTIPIVRVSIDYTYHFLILPNFDTIDLSVESVMRMEG